jgi:hypothetical protein
VFNAPRRARREGAVRSTNKRVVKGCVLDSKHCYDACRDGVE